MQHLKQFPETHPLVWGWFPKEDAGNIFWFTVQGRKGRDFS